MNRTDADIAALIGSRICHDLISPIGAIDNGLELLAMAGVVPGPEIDLITQSVSNASARIKLFRIAFGAAGDQMVGRSEVVAILRAVYDRGRIQPTWTPGGPQPRSAVRMALLALMCLETAMPYGGQVELAENEGTWTVKGKADKVNVDSDLWSVLARHDAPLSVQPSQVQFALLPALASQNGRRITASSDANHVTIQF